MRAQAEIKVVGDQLTRRDRKAIRATIRCGQELDGVVVELLYEHHRSRAPEAMYTGRWAGTIRREGGSMLGWMAAARG